MRRSSRWGGLLRPLAASNGKAADRGTAGTNLMSCGTHRMGTLLPEFEVQRPSVASCEGK